MSLSYFYDRDSRNGIERKNLLRVKYKYFKEYFTQSIIYIFFKV